MSQNCGFCYKKFELEYDVVAHQILYHTELLIKQYTTTRNSIILKRLEKMTLRRERLG